VQKSSWKKKQATLKGSGNGSQGQYSRGRGEGTGGVLGGHLKSLGTPHLGGRKEKGTAITGSEVLPSNSVKNQRYKLKNNQKSLVHILDDCLRCVGSEQRGRSRGFSGRLKR